MAPQIKGTAIYKKKQGTFNISNDEKSILWHPSQPKDAPRGVNITVASISSMFAMKFILCFILTKSQIYNRRQRQPRK